MATKIYINTDLKDLTANAVANKNRPTQVVRLPQIVEGETLDVELSLVNSDGGYDSRSGDATVSLAVAVSARGAAATSGTFTLTASTETTAPLAWNASAEAVEGALNALNSVSGAYGSKVDVKKLNSGSYRIIFKDPGARTDFGGTSIDLAPESEVTIATAVVGSATIRAQMIIEISQQPAIYTSTWTTHANKFSGQLNANTARVQELIATGQDAFFEVKADDDVICQVPIAVLPAVAAPNSLPAHTLPSNLNDFANDPSTNGNFNPTNWREDLSLNNYAPINNPTFTGTVTIPSADITTADFNAAGLGGEVSWNDQEKTLDLVTGSDNVTVQIGQEVTLFARNSSGAAMSDGQVVMVDGSQGNKPTISLAQADTVENARKTIGIVTQPIPNNSNGFVTLIGKVRDLVLDSGTFTEGDVVYLSSTIAGGITNVKPNIIVELGHVLATSNGSNTNGVLEVQINNESAVYELEQELTTDLNVKDSLTITADKSPDEDAKIELIDKSTGATKQGGLYKKDGALYVGTYTDYLKNLKCTQQGSGQVYDFPANSGIRFHNGNLLEKYNEGTFLPKLESGDGTVVQSVYDIRQANYVRIGDFVQVNIYISITNFDTAWKTSTKDWRITDLPYKAIGNHNIEIRPIFGWLDLGNNNITGSLASGNDYLWIEQFIDGGTTAGANTNLQRINGNRFVTHPFNFTTGSFRFVITGSYKTNEA